MLLSALVDPSRYDPRALMTTRSAGRLARSNAEAAVDRLLGEPAGVQPIPRETAVSVLAALRRSALAALALHSVLEHQPRRTFPWLAPLAADLPDAAPRVRICAPGGHGPADAGLRAEASARAAMQDRAPCSTRPSCWPTAPRRSRRLSRGHGTRSELGTTQSAARSSR